MTVRDTLITEFLESAGWAGAVRETLAADASFRRYDRVRLGNRSAVIMDAPPEHEDIDQFINLAYHLRGLGYSAPEPIKANADIGLLLLEDLGDNTFTRMLARGADERSLYLLAIDLLIDLHRKPRERAVFDALPPYSDQLLLEEAALLVDWYIPAVLGKSLADEARERFLMEWGLILPLARYVPETLVLRDYHVDNLIRINGRDGIAACGLLDFQDAVAGPVTYDFISLMEDARHELSETLVQELRERYLDALPHTNADNFDQSCAILGAQRHCKVIGIFTRLCIRDGKTSYLNLIPRVLQLLEIALTHPVLTGVTDWLNEQLPTAARIIPPCNSAA